MKSALAGLSRISASPDARRFALMIFLVGLGVEVSRAAQTTFFLQNVGADKLPLVFVCFAAVMVTMPSKTSTRVRSGVTSRENSVPRTAHPSWEWYGRVIVSFPTSRNRRCVHGGATASVTSSGWASTVCGTT